jgi:hypothetical protein
LIIDQNPSAGRMMSVNPAKRTPLEDKFILTSEEAAEFLGVSLRTIRYWVAVRRIPYFHRTVHPVQAGRPDGLLGVWSRRGPGAPTDDFNCFDRTWRSGVARRVTVKNGMASYGSANIRNNSATAIRAVARKIPR